MALKVGELYYDVTADTGKLVGQSRVVEQQTQRMGQSFNAVTVAVKALAAAYTILRVTQLAEQFRLLTSRVQIAAGGVTAGAEAMRELQSISTRTQTALEANVQVFTRLNSSILQMGGTQQDTLRLTEILGQAIKVSGASAAEAASAMTQFGQALGSGKLAGDELRSLLEAAPYLMKQLADGLGVPIGALKQLGEEGKLTADVVTEALGKAAGRIEADFKQLPQTMAGSLQVAQDAVQHLAEQLDTLSGTSAAVTGVTSGFGTVVDMLAESLAGATGQADALGRSRTVQTWANATTKVLSYVIDAADFVTRGFRQMAAGITGLSAVTNALAEGSLSKAIVKFGQMKQEVLSIGQAQYAGSKIRSRVDALANSTDGSDPMDRRARGGGFSRLRAPTAAATAGGRAGRAARDPAEGFDSAGYLASLEKTTLEGVALVDAAEQEALRRNAELLSQRKINAQTAAQAITLIERNAAQERREIAEQSLQDQIARAAEAQEAEARAAEQLAQTRARGLQMAQDAATVNDPVAQLELRLARESALLTEYAMLDMTNAQLYAEAKVALEQETAMRIAEIRQKAIDQEQANNQQILGMASNLAGQLLGIEEGAGRERSALAKALFLTQKALAVAEIIVNTERGAAAALAMGPPGIPLATMIRVAGYASAGIAAGQAIAEVAGGRQYGGPVSAGSLYRVNETGRPEMFTAANGEQYMMPTRDGNVTPANKLGTQGGTVIHVTQHFNFSNPADPRTQQQIGAAAARGMQMAAGRNN